MLQLADFVTFALFTTKDLLQRVAKIHDLIPSHDRKRLQNQIKAYNHQENAIIEHICQKLGNIVGSLQIWDDIDEFDPWSGILVTIMYALRAMYHTTTQATPMQLVFGRDTMLNV